MKNSFDMVVSMGIDVYKWTYIVKEYYCLYS